MDAQEIIATKRDGRRNATDQLERLAQGAADGSIPDYQLSAWLMAAYLNGLDDEETAALTLAMAHSGERLDLSALPHPWVDKHSTGGVGDKTTLVVLPMLAACGLTVVKMSGRGLGITGGTVDKLLSVPGFRMDLSPEEMVEQAARIGIAITGQTPRLAPADKALYALRDATGTVASIPLIVSSILSKKIAGGAEVLSLDVKCGSGAFMPDLESARRLASKLRMVGERAGLKVGAEITDMSQPLGSAVGNALEVLEAIDTLSGHGPQRFRELCISLTASTLTLCGMAPQAKEARSIAEGVLASGAARQKAVEWFTAQGASQSVFESPSWAPQAPVLGECVYQGEAGYIAAWPAKVVGEVVVALGGGRTRKEDAIDPSVGVVSHVEVGQRIEPGQSIATIHARSELEAAIASRELCGCLAVSDSSQTGPPVVLT